MVSTRAQEATANQLPRPGQQEVQSDQAFGAAPPPLQPLPQPDLLAALAIQVQNLTAVIEELRQTQPLPTERPQIEVPATPVGDPSAQKSPRQRSPSLVSPLHGSRLHPGSRHQRPPVSQGRSHRSSRRRSPRAATPEKLPHKEPSGQQGVQRGKRLRRERRSHSEPSSCSSLGLSREGSSGEGGSRAANRRLDEHDRKLRDVNRRLAEIRRDDRDSPDRDTRPPLSRQILEESVPSRFKMPQLEPYDGTTDPLDHLESFKALMRLQGASDALLCLAFPATLRKAARAWYTRLAPGSIHSFYQLEKKFVSYFLACRKMPREADSLFSLRQKEGEILKDFVARFKAATLEVYHLDESVAT